MFPAFSIISSYGAAADRAWNLHEDKILTFGVEALAVMDPLLERIAQPLTKSPVIVGRELF